MINISVGYIYHGFLRYQRFSTAVFIIFHSFQLSQRALVYRVLIYFHRFFIFSPHLSTFWTAQIYFHWVCNLHYDLNRGRVHGSKEFWSSSLVVPSCHVRRSVPLQISRLQRHRNLFYRFAEYNDRISYVECGFAVNS